MFCVLCTYCVKFLFSLPWVLRRTSTGGGEYALRKSMSMEMDEEDVNELPEEHCQELMMENLKTYRCSKHTELLQEIGLAKEAHMEAVISIK